MVQGYYTLEEAARILGMATDELSQMAQRRQVRAFADRGTWRFRTQDIEELARRRGQGLNRMIRPPPAAVPSLTTRECSTSAWAAIQIRSTWDKARARRRPGRDLSPAPKRVARAVQGPPAPRVPRQSPAATATCVSFRT